VHHQRGWKHVIFNLVQALINPGDEVIIRCRIGSPIKSGELCRWEVRVCPTDEENGFYADGRGMVEPYLTAKTKNDLINSPSNPARVLPSRRVEKIIAPHLGGHSTCSPTSATAISSTKAHPFRLVNARCQGNGAVAAPLSKTYAMTDGASVSGLVPEAIGGAMLKLQSHRIQSDLDIPKKPPWRRYVVRQIRSKPCWRNIAGGAILSFSVCDPFRA